MPPEPLAEISPSPGSKNGAHIPWYVALAEETGCPLLTLDRRLSRASGPKCEIVIPPWEEREKEIRDI